MFESLKRGPVARPRHVRRRRGVLDPVKAWFRGESPRDAEPDTDVAPDDLSALLWAVTDPVGVEK